VIIIFTGPTISPDDCRAILPAEYLQPASQGDVYRATLHRPFAIGIIDGYFEQVPSVWHKEILWALAQGIHVFGSASMGALRAAELEAFGMRGVGDIFTAFRNGLLEDDDEVAVVHAPAELGYRPLSEPMTNIRATLAAAGIFSPKSQEALITIAKTLHFSQRKYDHILELGAAMGIPRPEIDAFSSWLPNGRVDAKRQDATAMLKEMAHLSQNRSPSPASSFVFEATALWLELIRSAGTLQSQQLGIVTPMFMEDFIDRFKAKGHMTPQLRETILARVLGLDESRRHGLEISAEVIESAILDFRTRHGLLCWEDLEEWMDENDLDLAQFLALMEQEARLTWTRSMLKGELEAVLVDHLRAENQYSQFKRTL
jgi:hypothetical protein